MSIPNTTTIPVPTNSIPTPHTHKPLHSTVKFLTICGKLDEALQLIESHPITHRNLLTYETLLRACIAKKSLHHGQRLHAQLLRSRGRKGAHHNLLNNPALKSKLITLYSVCNRINLARLLFYDGEIEMIPESVWVSMAIGYSRNGYSKDALSLYVDMLRFLRPGNFMFSVALKSCGELFTVGVGRGVHAQIVKSEEGPDQFVYNALLRLYSECGCFEDVVRMFDEMPQRDIVSWNLLISGFAGKGQLFEAFDAFRRMQVEGVGFDGFTLTAALPVCARINALSGGKEMHAQMVKSVIRPNVFALNSLMDMYSKCGVVDYARRIFDGMGRRRDLRSWNTMLNGYAISRRMEEGLKLFDEMLGSGFSPNTFTFDALMSGCSHMGLTTEGETLFHRMQTEFGISPSVEHYACLVDILGRAGRLKEALGVVKNMHEKPSGRIWGLLLNSCHIYGDLHLAETISKVLFEIEPKYVENYVVLLNIYENAGLWEGVKMVRVMMEKHVKKEVGCSWIEIKNRFHTFVAGGDLELGSSEEYQKLWSEFKEAMRVIGYYNGPDYGVVLRDVNEEIKKAWICGHSERLAAMFGLIHTGSGIPLRITKNLRVCADCHSWMKIMSQVTGRVFVLRETKHFHHFEKGSCSCKDYW
ncbi:hypothetical protein RHSIM_Rhsim12G0110900 [Rhododendron simsii]|uniref:DYW domain-containing protein n=1 Tax=Rhododendron simsii TaxID=118357 RepID=A0A834G483_RHOSS|nr:hypothetical protein RHSIM_Rhsim12G0110900 [Rhododendron simsii]